jgi:hypothetical protein
MKYNVLMAIIFIFLCYTHIYAALVFSQKFYTGLSSIMNEILQQI